MSTSAGPMRIRLSEERRAALVAAARAFFADELEHELSDFQAERVIDFFIPALGAPVYNQAIRDARAFVVDKLDDLSGEFYEPES